MTKKKIHPQIRNVQVIHQLKKMVLTSFLIGVSIILTRFLSPYIPLFGSNSFRIGLGTLPIIFCAVYCGPIYGAICGFFADLIGSLLFPSGPYLFGFSISGLLTGLVPGITYLLMTKFSKFKIKVFIPFLLTIAILIPLTIFLFKYDGVAITKNNYIIFSNTVKIIIFISYLVLFLIFSLIIFFINKKYKNDVLKRTDYNSFSNISNIFIVVATTEVLVLVLFSSIWKQIYFNIDYMVSFFTSSILMFFNIIIKSLVLYLIIYSCSGIIESNFNFRRNINTKTKSLMNKKISDLLLLK